MGLSRRISRECGRKAAQDWLSQHYEDLGIRNTLDLSWTFDESLKPAHLPEGAERGICHQGGRPITFCGASV